MPVAELRLRRAFASGLVGLRLLGLLLGLRGVARRSGRVAFSLLLLLRLLFLLLGGRLLTTRLLGEDGHRERERDAERQCTDERVLHFRISFCCRRFACNAGSAHCSVHAMRKLTQLLEITALSALLS